MKLSIEYIAGFVDGEGCIYAQVRPNQRLDTKLIITNTDLSVLKDIQEFFGCGTIRLKSRGSTDRARKTCYLYEVWAQEAADVITKLLPYLRQKKPQAELILELREYCLSRKNYAIGRSGTVPLSEEEKEKRAVYVNKIKELKRA